MWDKIIFSSADVNKGCNSFFLSFDLIICELVKFVDLVALNLMINLIIFHDHTILSDDVLSWSQQFYHLIWQYLNLIRSSLLFVLLSFLTAPVRRWLMIIIIIRTFGIMINIHDYCVNRDNTVINSIGWRRIRDRCES